VNGALLALALLARPLGDLQAWLVFAIGFEICRSRSACQLRPAHHRLRGHVLLEGAGGGDEGDAAWRNVFLLAAGRCFVYQQQQHLRDTIISICQELNDDLAGPVGRAVLAGSTLALELLEDGLARRQPRYARDLATLAVRLSPPVF
jgi:hypothetical protein